MPDKPVAQETPAVKRRKGPILILVAALLLLAGGGAAAWVLMKPAAPGNEAGDSAPVRAKKHASLFVPLDPFTVNLADEGGERMAQIAVTLEVANGEAEAALKARMPALRNNVLLQLTASQSSELLTVAGKQRLAARIAQVAGEHLGWTSAPTAQAIQPPGKSTAVAGTTSAAKPVHGDTAKAAAQDATQAPADPNPVEAVHFSQFIVQ